MADATQILKNVPAQVSLYDATNGILNLGYLAADNLMVSAKPLFHKIIDGNRNQYGTRTKFVCRLLETNPSKLAALTTRRSYKQSVFIVTAEYGVRISNCYINYFQSRDMEIGGDSFIQVEFHTDIESDVEVLKNLLGATGNMDVDTNTDGMSDGWVEDGTLDDYDRTTPSFLGAGFGSDQRIEVTSGGADAGIYNAEWWPIDQLVKVTVSAYVQYNVNEDNTFIFQIRTKEFDDSPIDTYESSQMTATSSPVRYSYTHEFTPGADTYKIAFHLLIEAGESSDLFIDNAQMEFGSLSAYTEND
jgi:hypothetical protein